MKNEFLESIEKRISAAMDKAAEQAKPLIDVAKPYIDAAKEKAGAAAEQAKPYIDAAAEQAKPLIDAAKPYLDIAKEKAGAAAETAEEIIRLTVVPESKLEMAAVDSARMTFTGFSEADESERRFVIEFLAVKEKHLKVTAGVLEQNASRVFPWEEVHLKADSPYQIGAGSCYLSETRTLGQVVELPAAEGEEGLRVIWDLHMEEEQMEGRIVMNGAAYRVSPETSDVKLSVEGLKEIVL